MELETNPYCNNFEHLRESSPTTIPNLNPDRQPLKEGFEFPGRSNDVQWIEDEFSTKSRRRKTRFIQPGN